MRWWVTGSPKSLPTTQRLIQGSKLVRGSRLMSRISAHMRGALGPDLENAGDYHRLRVETPLFLQMVLLELSEAEAADFVLDKALVRNAMVMGGLGADRHVASTTGLANSSRGSAVSSRSEETTAREFKESDFKDKKERVLAIMKAQITKFKDLLLPQDQPSYRKRLNDSVRRIPLPLPP